MLSYYNKYNLLNATQFEDVSENCLLFSVVHHFLTILSGKEVDSNEKQNIINYIDLLWNQNNGMFNNIPDVLVGKDAYISKDQYVALCSFSKYYDLDYHKRFWKGVNLGTYDNLSGKFNISRIMPLLKEYIYCGLCVDNVICRILKPIYYMSTFFSFYNDEKARPYFWERLKSGFKLPKLVDFKTDGQILAFVSFFSSKSTIDKIFWNFLMKFCQKRYEYGFQHILTYYYKPHHPNHDLAKGIYTYVI